MLKCFITHGVVSIKYSDMFPIKSETELKEIEDKIKEDTKVAMVKYF